MDPKVLERLRELGAIDRLSNGQYGVRVTLMWTASLSEPSLCARRDLLLQKFEGTANDILPDGAEVYLNSISISAQTVEAILPIDNYDYITDRLKQQSIRVDPLIRERLV